jgi:hypothetical protein
LKIKLKKNSGRKKLQNLKPIEIMCDGSVFSAAVPPVWLMALQTAAALQAVSEWVHTWFKFRLTIHK